MTKIDKSQNRQISVDDVFDMYNMVSKVANEYEKITKENIPIEVNNEFRYAFRSFIDYYDKTPEDKNTNNYHIVRTHYALMCAYFDIIDGLIISIHLYLDKLLNLYPKETIKMITNIEDINDYISIMEDKISKSRSNNQDKKLQIYEEIYNNDFIELSGHYTNLRDSYEKIFNSYSKIKAFFNKCWYRGKSAN